MIRNAFLLIASVVILASCGGPTTVEVKFDKYGVTMMAAEGKKQPGEYKESGLDGKIGRYDFNIGKRRLNFDEIEGSIYPENAQMLADAISADEDFIGMENGDKHPNGIAQFANGVFGVVYSKKSSKGEPMKDYAFYYTKDGRFFRLTPVFNSELKDLEQQLAAFESLK